jgi:carboxymethylenebutenolidase
MASEFTRDYLQLPVAGETSVMDAFVVRPAGDSRPPVVIVGMELFGVNDHIREVTERIARLGYVAIAPNFYHRTLPGDALPMTAEGRKLGFQHLAQLTRERVLRDVDAVLRYARGRSTTPEPVGFVGFSVGGHIAFLAATQFDFAACACFYAGWLLDTQIAMSQPEPTASLSAGIARGGGKLLYFAAGQDQLVTREQRDRLSQILRESGVRHQMVVYEQAQHGFFCNQRDTFDQAAHDDAWARVTTLLSEEIGAMGGLAPSTRDSPR